MIRANMTAYSTAVGPSSPFKNSTTNRSSFRMRVSRKCLASAPKQEGLNLRCTHASFRSSETLGRARRTVKLRETDFSIFDGFEDSHKGFRILGEPVSPSQRRIFCSGQNA